MKKLSWCMHCKKKTGDKNISIVKAKNGKHMQKSNCVICGGKKCTFISSQSGKGIVDKFVENLPVELHLLGTKHTEEFEKNDKSLTGVKDGKTMRMQYAGPGTKYDMRYARGDRGINDLDHAAMFHDLAYKNTDPRARNTADDILASKARAYLQKPGLSVLDKIDGHIVEKAMKLIKRKV